MRLKVSSAKRWPFCLGLIELTSVHIRGHMHWFWSRYSWRWGVHDHAKGLSTNSPSDCFYFKWVLTTNIWLTTHNLVNISYILSETRCRSWRFWRQYRLWMLRGSMKIVTQTHWSRANSCWISSFRWRPRKWRTLSLLFKCNMFSYSNSLFSYVYLVILHTCKRGKLGHSVKVSAWHVFLCWHLTVMKSYLSSFEVRLSTPFLN